MEAATASNSAIVAKVYSIADLCAEYQRKMRPKRPITAIVSTILPKSTRRSLVSDVLKKVMLIVVFSRLMWVAGKLENQWPPRFHEVFGFHRRIRPWRSVWGGGC